MDDFYFDDDREEKIKFIKKIVIITVVFIIIFLILRSCTNHLTNKIMEDIENDKKVIETEKQNDGIDLNKSFSYYNITTNDELHSFLRLVGENLVPSSLSNYIDYEKETGFSINGYNWNAYNNLYEILDMLRSKAYRNILKQILYNKVDYDYVPLTEHFRKKFKDGFLGKHSYLCGVAGWIYYDYEKRYFVLQANNGEARDDYYFNFILDEDGYIDDVVLDKIVPMYDEEGIYIPKKDSKLMNNEKDASFIIEEILFNTKFYAVEGDAFYNYEKDPQSRYNIFKEIGLTDRFRDFYNSLNGKGFIEEDVVYEEGDRIYIEDVNINDKKAKLKLEFFKSKKTKYYDLSWTTDNQYRLDSFSVKFDREE